RDKMGPLVVHRLMSRCKKSFPRDKRTEAIWELLHHFIIVEVEAWSQPRLNINGLVVTRGPLVPRRVLSGISWQVGKGLLVDETEVFSRLLCAFDLDFWIGTLKHDLVDCSCSDDVWGLELILRASSYIDFKG